MVKLTGTLGLHSETWQTVPSDSNVLIFASTNQSIFFYTNFPVKKEQKMLGNFFKKIWENCYFILNFNNILRSKHFKIWRRHESSTARLLVVCSMHMRGQLVLHEAYYIRYKLYGGFMRTVAIAGTTTSLYKGYPNQKHEAPHHTCAHHRGVRIREEPRAPCWKEEFTVLFWTLWTANFFNLV